jgi:hypothetical protein
MATPGSVAFAGKFHEWAAQQNGSSSSSGKTLSSYDAYVLLEILGWGMHLKKDWKPTLICC